VDVLITIVQVIAVLIMIVGVSFVEDRGVQIIFIGAFILTVMVMLEARRSA
jgi:hypothetical protein